MNPSEITNLPITIDYTKKFESNAYLNKRVSKETEYYDISCNFYLMLKP